MNAPATLPVLAVEAFDPYTDTIVIEGVRYAGEFFRGATGFAGAVGMVLRIERRSDDVVTVTRLREHEASIPAGVPAKE